MKPLQRKIISGVLAILLLAVSTAAFAATTNITGFVTVRGGKYVLLSLNDVYVLEGNEVNSKMLGKDVMVTGAVEEKNEIKTIDVYLYEEIEE